jgi:hypothetical protein
VSSRRSARHVSTINGFLRRHLFKQQAASRRRTGQSGEKEKGRIFFFVNKKEAKKTLIILERARFTAMGPD